MKRALIGLLMLATGGMSIADEQASPAEAFEGWVLAVHGGPVSADVELEVNGEFAMSIVEDPPLFTSIADLLKPGLNTLRIVLGTPASPRATGGDMGIEIWQTEMTSRGKSTVGQPHADVVVPADGPAGCEEKVRFWAGPRPSPAPEIKDRYWLFVTGPPVGLRVAAIVNGTVVADLTSGNRFIEITPFTLKGKNSVVFESEPTCLPEKTGGEGPLVFEIGAAKLDVETVKMTEPAQVLVTFARRKSVEPQTVSRVFRVR